MPPSLTEVHSVTRDIAESIHAAYRYESDKSQGHFPHSSFLVYVTIRPAALTVQRRAANDEPQRLPWHNLRQLVEGEHEPLGHDIRFLGGHLNSGPHKYE